METNSLNFFGRELPSSLGYGVLDKSSVKIENEVISADYLLECDRSVVHIVKWEKDRCELRTLIHGEFCGTSTYPGLEHVLTNDFFVRDFSKDPVFLFLGKETSRRGNIWIQHPLSKEKEQQKIIYYPAGLLMLFRLPILSKGQQYASFLETLKPDQPISFFRERKGFLLVADVFLNVKRYPIIIAEFIVPLARMWSAAGTFAGQGIIDPRRPNRLIIDESGNAESTFMQIYPGDLNNPCFAIVFKDCDEKQREGIAKLLSDSLRGKKTA
ncbi:MAG: hypothetical protein ACOYM0_03520 [Bacteroidales bacterium]